MHIVLHSLYFYKKIRGTWSVLLTSILLVMLVLPLTGNAQSPWEKLAKRPSTLGLEQGVLTFHTGTFTVKLVKASQTIASLAPNDANGFDFTPADKLDLRSKDGMYQLGDLTLRFRKSTDTTWVRCSTAAKRGAIVALPTTDSVLAAADLAGTLPADIPLKVERYWKLHNNVLCMEFKITNKTSTKIEIGDLGMPLIFNNIMEGKSLEEAHASNVFYDPYIGLDAGYVQVTRLSGHGPVLLVIPSGHTPFEAYNPLLDDPTPRGITFEGFYEWMVHSKAAATVDWKAAKPWNTPTSYILKPGESYTFGLGFILTNTVKNIEQTLSAHHRPVAIGIPGYVLPEDVNGRLFLKYQHPVSSITVEPAGALQINELDDVKPGIHTFEIRGKIWGRARLSITYADGLKQTVHYKVIKPETELVEDYGSFLTSRQWYHNPSDPFKRNNSVISYDYDKKQQVTQESRVWIAGLSDEAGAGSWLGAMMKEFVHPNKTEIDKLQVFANHTLWGGIQHNTGDEKYGVKKSMFYYQPDSMPKGTYDPNINYKTWAAWDHKSANDIGRSYNYPHVAAAHWVLYRLARNHSGLVTEMPWQWHLNNAFGTAMAMVNLAPYYAQFGQMEGTIFYLILKDLKDEGWIVPAQQLEAAMKKRADHWRTLQYPFGSEMPWDSTGQEEVYVWSKYFGYNDKANVTIDAILAYMPTVPHWGYNGSARRYWDFLYGGKLTRIERQLHHYGSGLNAIPVLSAYRDHPHDLYLLRVGYGGTMGAISNITQEGFGSAAFHSFPSTLNIDAYSSDYGPNFFGYAINSGTYILYDDVLGWLAFGGNLNTNGNWINVKLTTAAQSSVFIAPLHLWLKLNAGTFNSIAYNSSTGQLQVLLNPKDKYTPAAFLRIEREGNENSSLYTLKGKFKRQRGAFVLPLTTGVSRFNIIK